MLCGFGDEQSIERQDVPSKQNKGKVMRIRLNVCVICLYSPGRHVDENGTECLQPRFDQMLRYLMKRFVVLVV